MLYRIAAILTRMAMKFDGVADPRATYDAEIDYDNEHRCAEHEHESQTEECGSPRLADTCGSLKIPAGGMPCPEETALKNASAKTLNAMR